MRLKKKINQIIDFLENSQSDFKTWAISFLVLISTRLLIESLILGFPERTLESFLVFFLHSFLFFFLTYLIFLVFLIFLIKENFKKVANFLLWGFGIIILPPIFDSLIFQDQFYKSFYIFDSFQGLIVRFFTFFGENPDWGITWGTRINILISLVGISLYVYLKTKNKKKTITGLVGGYFLFFCLSCFPSIVVYLIEIRRFWEISYSTVAGYFMTSLSAFGLENIAIESFLGKKLALIYLPLILSLIIGLSFWLKPKKTISLIKNLRYPQLFFNLGLLFIGLGLGFFYYQENFQINSFSILVVLNLILVVIATWFFSVFINDLSDLSVDKISNKNRPLIKKEFSSKEYLNYAQVFFWFSVFGASLISPVILLVIISYHLLTWIYSCQPFRLKRFLGISNVLIALASLNFLIIGFLVFSENQTLMNFPWRIYGFLFLAYLLIIPLKDLKDLEGDQRNGVYTLVVLIGRKNARLVMASCLFSLYLISVYILNQQKLFLMALVLGVVNFLIINNPKINERKLNSLVLGLVFVYSLWIIKTIFL